MVANRYPDQQRVSKSVSTMIALSHANDGFKIDSAPFFPHFLLLLVRPVHEEVIVNTSLSRILFFDLAACSGKYTYTHTHAIDGLGGGLS